MTNETALREDDLRPWGYAPGGYFFKCVDCPPDQPMIERPIGDKRAWRCKDHALAERAKTGDHSPVPRVLQSPSQPVEEPTAKGDRVAGLMREHFEAHKHEKWDGFTADNLMIRLLNIALREYRLVEPSQPVVAEADGWQHRLRQRKEHGFGEWSEWRDGKAGSFSSRYIEVEDRPLYAHPQASPPPVQGEVTNGQYEADDMGPIGDAARHICSWAEGDVRLNVYKAAKQELARLAHSQTDTQEGDSVAFLATTDWSDEAKRSWEAQTGQPADQMPLPDMNEALCKIADAVVPEYRTTAQSYSCSGHHAKRWGAAYQGAFMAITGKSS